MFFITEGKYGNQLKKIRKFRDILSSGSHKTGSRAKIKKIFGNFLGGGEGIRVILFIPRTVSKYKVQLLPSKVCDFLYLLKGGYPTSPQNVT